MNQIRYSTHGEFLRQFPTPGFEPSDCPGELTWEGHYPDILLDGVHQIEVFRCRKCNATISLDGTAGLLRNVYDPRRRKVP